MYQDENQNGPGFAFGVLSGAVIGAGLALLFAPKPGRELRADLSESMESLSDAVAHRYEELARKAGVELVNLRETVEHATAALDARAREVVQSAAQKARGAERGV
jgi:gas vesicle protein